MLHKALLASVALAATLAARGLEAQQPPAPLIRHSSTSSPLFANYYVPAVMPQGVGAQMYPSPRPTPPLVGHTYVTYQPLAPQEFLYEHCRVYVRKNPCAGPTVTCVCWKHCPTLWPFTPSMSWALPALPHHPAGPATACTP
jgi:hypothetical protein